VPEALNLSLIVYGLGIFIALLAALLIKGIVGFLSWTDRAAAAPVAGTAKPASIPTSPQAQAVTPEGIPPHHLVVIAACAHAIVGAHRILHIGSNAGAAGWSAEGRFAQHGSHHPSTHH